MSDDRNGPRSTTSAQQQRAERASAKRQEAERELASSRTAEKKLARLEASEHRKAQRTSAKRRQAQQEAAEHRRAERELAARRQVEHVAAHQQQLEQEAAARRQAKHEDAQREVAARREAQQEAAEHRRAEREAAEHREAERQEAARLKAERALPDRRRPAPARGADRPAAQEDSGSQKAPGLLLLLAGLAAGALVAAVISARKTAKEAPTVSERELVLRDEEAWTYETKLVVYAPAGAIAGHVHDVGGFPGLVGPLDGPPMDRVDWTEPEGARLRFQVHARSGGGPSDTTVQIARGSRTGPLNGLESEVRDALAALRTQLERA